MKPPFTFFALGFLALASCGKNDQGEKTDTQSNAADAPAESRQQAPTIAEQLHAERPAGGNNPTYVTPENPSMVRPKGVSSSDESWAQLSGPEMLEQFKAKGIAGVPSYVNEQIIGDSASLATADEQVGFIIEQAAAWHHVDQFRNHSDEMPDNRKGHLVDMLTKKHGESWQSVAAELDEQVAASNQLMELRLKGIPGMTPEETEALVTKAMERLLPDYKAILEIARMNAE